MTCSADVIIELQKKTSQGDKKFEKYERKVRRGGEVIFC